MIIKNYVEDILLNFGYQLYQKILPHRFPSGLDLAYDLKRMVSTKQLKNIFDVGANVGQTARYFNQKFPRSIIYSFEPVNKTFQALKINVNHLTNTKCFQHGFGDKEQEMEIYVRDDSSVYSSLVFSQGKSSKEIVQVKTLDNFCDENNINSIDILKTDTEGYDLEVLRGGSKMLEARKIKFVLSEVAFYPGKENTQFLPIFDFLSPYGFRFYGLYDCAYWDTNLAKGIMFSNALFVNEKLVKQQKT